MAESPSGDSDALIRGESIAPSHYAVEKSMAKVVNNPLPVNLERFSLCPLGPYINLDDFKERYNRYFDIVNLAKTNAECGNQKMWADVKNEIPAELEASHEVVFVKEKWYMILTINRDTNHAYILFLPNIETNGFVQCPTGSFFDEDDPEFGFKLTVKTPDPGLWKFRKWNSFIAHVCLTKSHVNKYKLHVDEYIVKGTGNPRRDQDFYFIGSFDASKAELELLALISVCKQEVMALFRGFDSEPVYQMTVTDCLEFAKKCVREVAYMLDLPSEKVNEFLSALTTFVGAAANAEWLSRNSGAVGQTSNTSAVSAESGLECYQSSVNHN